MNNKIFYLLFFICFTQNTFAQYWFGWQHNLIHNAGFEDGESTPQCFGDDFEKIHVWESRFDPCECGKDTDPVTGNYCFKKHYHSPDWLKSPALTACLSFPFEGSHYVGMSEYELIQQKFFKYNKLEEGESYLLTMYLFNHSLSIYGSPSYPSESVIKIYLAKNKIKYQEENCLVTYNDCSGFYTHFCSSEYKNHKIGWPQDIIEIASFDLANFNTDEWVLIQKEISSAPNENYEWFVIETRAKDGRDDCGYTYVGVDWVMFSRGCTNGCSSTAGAYNISNSGYHYQTDPFTISGLENISEVKIEIWQITGGEVIPDIIIVNPQNCIAWNGKNSYGSEVASGTYGYRVTVTNDCGTKEVSGNFIKVNASSNPTLDAHPYFNYNPVSKPPLPDCCEDYIVLQNQYLIQDKTIGVPDPLLYKAEIKISAGPEVVIQSGNTVIFEAGYEIDLLPGFTVEAGANFTAQITPCLDLSNKNMLAGNDNNRNDNVALVEAKPSIEENNFSVYPNPFSSSFTISLELDELSEAEIFLVNIHGRKVLQVFSGSLNKGTNNIEVSGVSLPQGMYFCVIETTQFRKVVKVIKM